MSLETDIDSAPHLHRALGTFHLVLLNVAAIVGFRWLSLAAQIGPSSLTLWALGLITFLAPAALTVLELGSRLPGEGASICGRRPHSATCMRSSAVAFLAIGLSFHVRGTQAVRRDPPCASGARRGG